MARLPTGVFLSVPVKVVRGRRSGPCVWLSAALHGDEINGVEIIREVTRQLDPARMHGTVVAVPVVNVFGFIAESRYLPDRRDLNRNFPGSPKGSLAARLADLFMSEVVALCTHGIDLHTGSNHRTNVPHVRADLDDPRSRALAEAFGTRLMIHGPGPDGSLRSAAAERGIPCLVFEAGEASRFGPIAIQVGVSGILNVLGELGVQRAVSLPGAVPPLRIDKTRWVRAKQSGVVRLHVQLGEDVRRGHLLATISDTFGDSAVELRAPARAVVLGLTRHPLVHRGEALVHLALMPRARHQHSTASTPNRASD